MSNEDRDTARAKAEAFDALTDLVERAIEEYQHRRDTSAEGSIDKLLHGVRHQTFRAVEGHMNRLYLDARRDIARGYASPTNCPKCNSLDISVQDCLSDTFDMLPSDYGKTEEDEDYFRECKAQGLELHLWKCDTCGHEWEDWD